MSGLNDVRLGLPSVLAITAIVGAGAFAAGRSTIGAPSTSSGDHREPAAELPPSPSPFGGGGAVPPGHGPTGDLPPGHPPLDPGSPAMPNAAPEREESELAWKVPPRWAVAENTSSMRLATYRVPRADGDPVDADVSVTRAGGAVQANVERWIDQFDAESRKRAKHTTTKRGAFEVTIVEVDGTYGGGMGGKTEAGWALLGAIVATKGMPHFFKITGPRRTVTSARDELDALLATLAEKPRP